MTQIRAGLFAILFASPGGTACESPGRKSWVSGIYNPESRRDDTCQGHSYSNVLLHIVFSTKNRRKIILPHHQEQLWKYITGIVHSLDGDVLAIGGMSDHIHMLLAQPGTIGFSTMIQKIKSNSSGWMEQTVRDFEWQEGFGAFTVSD